MTTLGTITPSGERKRIAEAKAKDRLIDFISIDIDYIEERGDSEIGFNIIEGNFAFGLAFDHWDIEKLIEVLRRAQYLMNKERSEMFAIKENGSYVCAYCHGPLNAVIGIQGREVCQHCKRILVTDPKAEGFDKRTYKHLGENKCGADLYGPEDESEKEIRADTPR